MNLWNILEFLYSFRVQLSHRSGHFALLCTIDICVTVYIETPAHSHNFACSSTMATGNIHFYVKYSNS